MKFVDLSSFVFPHFRKVFDAIIKNKYFRIVVKGGRSSGKSFLIAIAIIVYVLTNKKSCIAIVRTKTDVTKRLDNVFLKALTLLGLEKKFRYVSTKHTFILLNKNGTDSKIEIICTGADDPERLKGIQPKTGSWGILWIEEATNFDNIKKIKSIESTMGRGDIKHFTSVISYNPRQSTSHFLNIEFENVKEGDELISYDKDDETLTSTKIIKTLIEIDDNNKLELEQCVFHCTYKELIRLGRYDLISPTDLVDIKYGEEHQTEYWKWYYLGLACGSDTLNVFRNICTWHYDDSFKNNIIDRGLDFSNGASDPFAYTAWYYDMKNNDLYCMDEFVLGGSSTIEDVAVSIRKHNPVNLNVFTDGAVPKFTDQLNSAGIRAACAKKGPDSRMAGIFWLKSLNHIYIDESKCPNSWREFSTYEYKIDKRTEEVLPDIPDGKDHCIDSCRYAMSVKIRDASYVRGRIYSQV
jgi:phage terminase large subunit